jgi:hypothetical protein
VLSAAVNGDPASATAQARQQATWTVAYDSDTHADVNHIFGMTTTAQPVVWAAVQTLPEEARGNLSLDSLRNMVLPVTDTAREQATAQSAPLEGFELLGDEVITPASGFRGVHEVFNYRLGGTVHTFDQTALMNNDDSRVYLLFVRCSARCYTDRQAEISGIVSSFTVRSN